MMGENRSVHLSVELPSQVATKVEEIERTEPELLRGALEYMLARKSVFETLVRIGSAGDFATSPTTSGATR